MSPLQQNKRGFTVTELKKTICDKAYDLIFLLDKVEDEDFVDNIINCLMKMIS